MKGVVISIPDQLQKKMCLLLVELIGKSTFFVRSSMIEIIFVPTF